MRIAKTIFLILGIVSILLNLLAYVAGNSPYAKDPNADIGIKIGHFIGSNFLILLGLIFLFIANRIGKRIARKQDKNLVDSLFKENDNALFK